MPIDPSIALGFKQPDQTQQLSSLLGVANSAQTLQQNQQKTQQTGIDLQERQAMQRVMSDPTNYTDPQGNFDPMKAQQNIMRAAPTTGTKYWQEIASAHKMSTEATSALNTLTAQNRSVIGGALASLPADAPKELVHKTVDALNDQFGGRIGPLVDVFKRGYENASKGGPKAATDFVLQSARSVLPQETQQSMNTPSVMTLDNGQQTVGVNVKPGVQGIPQGAPIQGTQVQKVLPPTTPTVNPMTNQPGYLGAQPKANATPAADVHGNYVGDPNEVMGAISAIKDPQEHANALAAFNEQANRTPDFAKSGFVPSGPVPGANESKAGSVAVINDHWTKINQGAADTPTAMALLDTIKTLAPQAITGTESGKRAYWNGLMNALGLGDKKTGDFQRDTDLIQKSMAQLNLSTPATSVAMQNLIEAGRPHSTMSAAAIKEATAQITGQLKANMALRNLLSPDKQYASATGDTSHYEQKRQVLEPLMDPRIFQYESLPSSERKEFMSKIGSDERGALVKKVKQLEALGLFK